MNRQSLSSSRRAEQRHFNLTRRRFLQGLGTCIALPAFESLALPGVAGAAAPGGDGALAASTGSGLAVTAGGPPLRLAFVYFPNGAIPASWWPASEGADFQLSTTLAPWPG